MRVKALHDFTVYRDTTCQLLAFEAGQEITGWDAALAVGKHCPVEILEDDPAPAPVPDPEPAVEVETAAETPDPVFDPSEHTVAEVLAYAKDHPDVAEQIYAAEQAGRARTTILSTLA